MLFLVKDALVEVGKTPPERHVEIEQVGEDLCSSTGVGVPPCPERCKQNAFGIECQIAMHHGTYSYGSE